MDVEFCLPITDDNGSFSVEATLSFTYEGKHTIGSPQNIVLIPGPFNLAKSNFVEYSLPNGCLLVELCNARLDPRDDAYNLLR